MTEAAPARPSRLVVVTATHPWGVLEDFFDPELTVLSKHVDVLVVPVWPRRPRPARRPSPLASLIRHPAHPVVLLAAVLVAVRQPVTVLRLVRLLGSRHPRRMVRNLAVLPKGLWLGNVVRKRSVDHIHAYWASAPATVALIAAEVAGARWSMTAHRGDLAEQNLVPQKLDRVAWVRCVSSATVELLAQAARRSLDPTERHVVHLGISLPPVSTPAPRAGRPARVLCVAQLVPLKRHVDLVGALAQLVEDGMDVELLLAGSGPTEGAIRAAAAGLGLEDRVHLLGHVDHADLLERYPTGWIDVVVLASEVEGIPVSLMEAMAAGVPVVATAAGGVGELLRDGAGLMVPIGDVRALAGAIRRVLADDGERAALVDQGRRRVEDDFDAERTAVALLDLVRHG